VYEEGRGPRLAPFCDLVCTRVYPGIDRRLAMSVAGQRDPGEVRRADWQRQAAELGVGARLLLDEVGRLADALPAAFAAVAAAHRAAWGDSPVIERVGRVIAKQCRRTLLLFRA